MSRRHFLLRWPSLFVYCLVLIAGILGGYFWLTKQLAPVSASGQPQIFVIKKGQTITAIGQSLQTAGLIHSPLAFKYVVTQQNLAKKIQAGTFKISPAMSTGEIALALTRGTLDVWVTVLEGWRREEIAGAIAKDFTDAGGTFDQVKFLAATKGDEGFLFPDTYLFPLSGSEATIATLLKNTFDKKVTQDLAADITRSGKSLPQVITLASLVEREARSDTSRGMVAGILWKRIEAGWPLQVDASLQYASGYDAKGKTWWDPPSSLDKQINSPYNTYKNPGLPPGPICSPSLSSIKAALNPTASPYWFYLTGTDNQMHYAATVEEHNANIAKYLH